MTLEQAIYEGNKRETDRILMENPSLIDGESSDGVWLPFYAARLGNPEIMKYIVEYSRASFNTVDEKNRDVLHYGTESGNLELVRYLVERVGMSPVRGDAELVTPFDIAHNMGFKEIEKYYEGVCGAAYENMYRNPVLTGMHPDPSIVCVGDDFYMVNSSFIYFPCIPVLHSRDLIHWEVIGHAITNPEWSRLDNLEGGRGYWAPDISYYEGRFYITATYRLNDDGTVYRKQMVTSSERPEGPYCEPVFLDEDGIDPSIFTDDDGRRYMLLNRGARIFEISPDGKKQLSEAKLLYYGHHKRAPEGSHLLKKDGYYYLFEAEGGTGPGHRISVSRSKTLFGVYEPCPYNPIMRQQDEKAGIQRCGHGKPVKTPAGEWYMVYLCGRQIDGKYSMLGRETALDPIYWNSDGWPMVNMLRGPGVLQKKPDLPEWKPDKNRVLTGINPLTGIHYVPGEILTPEWVCPRPPEKGAIRQENEWVVIRGSKESLSSMHARNIVLRRQEHFRFIFEAEVIVPKLEEGQHFGITAYYDENTYVRYSVCHIGGRYTIEAAEHIGYETRKTCSESVVTEGDIIKLSMEADYLKRSFKTEVVNGMGDERTVNNILLDNVYYICDEGIKMGKRFTGAMAGIYAFAGEEKELEVKFRNIRYEGRR